MPMYYQHRCTFVNLSLTNAISEGLTAAKSINVDSKTVIVISSQIKTLVKCVVSIVKSKYTDRNPQTVH